MCDLQSPLSKMSMACPETHRMLQNQALASARADIQLNTDLVEVHRFRLFHEWKPLSRARLVRLRTQLEWPVSPSSLLLSAPSLHAPASLFPPARAALVPAVRPLHAPQPLARLSPVPRILGAQELLRPVPSMNMQSTDNR